MQLLPNLVLSRRYGLRKKKNPTIRSAYANPDPANRKGFGSDTHDRRPSRSLQSDSPQMGQGVGEPCCHTHLAVAVHKPLAARLDRRFESAELEWLIGNPFWKPLLAEGPKVLNLPPFPAG